MTKAKSAHGPEYEWRDRLPIPGVTSATPGRSALIQGVKIRRLPSFPDERGALTEILRADDAEYEAFGQIYMTTSYPGVVKGWHLHARQNDMVCCVSGELKLVLFDPREQSPTHGLANEIFLGDCNRLLVKVPVGVFHGWKCIGERSALVVNIPDRVYDYDDPDERRVDPHDNEIPYDWARRDR